MTKITVVGGRCAPFPLPMLRFAEAWPATDDDAMKIERSVIGHWDQVPDRQTIDLYTGQSHAGRIMSERRWASFGWQVLEED